MNLGGKGIRPPDSFSYRSNFRSRSSSCSTTSGDIFYCSGSRRLNHSSFVFCLFVCPSRYDARHRKPRLFVYALNLGGPGISPPDKSPPGQKTPRTKAFPDKNPPGQNSPRLKVPTGKRPPGKKSPGQKTHRTVLVFVIVLVPSVDIFYCSGSRQLNHSSFYCAMHFSANARSWDRISSVCPSVRL